MVLVVGLQGYSVDADHCTVALVAVFSIVVSREKHCDTNALITFNLHLVSPIYRISICLLQWTVLNATHSKRPSIGLDWIELDYYNQQQVGHVISQGSTVFHLFERESFAWLIIYNYPTSHHLSSVGLAVHNRNRCCMKCLCFYIFVLCLVIHFLSLM